MVTFFSKASYKSTKVQQYNNSTTAKLQGCNTVLAEPQAINTILSSYLATTADSLPIYMSKRQYISIYIYIYTVIY